MTEKDVKKCPHCGGEIQEGATFCLHCMEPFGEKRQIAKTDTAKKALSSRYALIFAVLLCITAAAFAAFFLTKTYNRSSGDTPMVDDSGGSYSTESKNAGGVSTDGKKGNGADRDLKKDIKTSINDETDTKDSAERNGLYGEAVADTDKTGAGVMEEREPVSDVVNELLDSGNYDAPSSKLRTQDPETSKRTPQTTSSKSETAKSDPGNSAAATTAARSSSTSAHVHSDSCYKWIVDVPYKAAVYKNVKVIDQPYKPAEYGDVLVEYTDYTCSVTLYPGDYETLTFPSEEKFDEWFDSHNGKEDYNKYGGEVRIDGSRVFYTMRHTSSYTAVRTEYGLISEEQPEISHIEKVLVSPEQKEEGHKELVCGYN